MVIWSFIPISNLSLQPQTMFYQMVCIHYSHVCVTSVTRVSCCPTPLLRMLTHLFLVTRNYLQHVINVRTYWQIISRNVISFISLCVSPIVQFLILHTRCITYLAFCFVLFFFIQKLSCKSVPKKTFFCHWKVFIINNVSFPRPGPINERLHRHGLLQNG